VNRRKRGDGEMDEGSRASKKGEGLENYENYRDRRRKRRIVDDRIKEGEWKEHFMRLLGGVEHRVREGEGIRRGEKEEEISRKKLMRP